MSSDLLLAEEYLLADDVVVNLSQGYTYRHVSENWAHNAQSKQENNSAASQGHHRQKKRRRLFVVDVIGVCVVGGWVVGSCYSNNL